MLMPQATLTVGVIEAVSLAESLEEAALGKATLGIFLWPTRSLHHPVQGYKSGRADFSHKLYSYSFLR